MSQISFDAQSLIVDDHRVWLVSGSIDYARVPRGLWRDRIRAAKQAGLNCIDTGVFWNIHERKSGKFNFEDELDLCHFVELIAEEGMYCTLRVGPHVGSNLDLGGLPAWLLRTEGIRLRQGGVGSPFMEAASRWFGRVMDQVRHLQAAPPKALAASVKGGASGPIVLFQIEDEWLCYNPDQGAVYLGELIRYLRENSCTVPIIEANNLWQPVEGAISTWIGSGCLTAYLRQLAIVQPEAPRFVSKYLCGAPGSADVWNSDRASDDADVVYDLASILASGAQYNLSMFHGGTNFGFSGAGVTTSHDSGAPLREGGGHGATYNEVKRISMFANHFGHVLAHLEPQPHHAVVSPEPEDEFGVTVINQRGSQGNIGFVFKSPKCKAKSTNVLLSNGLSMTVPMGGDRVAWFVTDVNLNGVATLSHTGLRPWAFVDDRLLVLFGPAGAAGAVCIDDAPLAVSVPRGKTPNVYEHEAISILVLNHDQVDAAVVGDDGVILDSSIVASDGSITKQKAPALPKPKAPSLAGWQCVPLDEFVSGESESFQSISGAPKASMEDLLCDEGYMWYRLAIKAAPTGKVMSPNSGDRLHVYSDGKLAAIVGDLDEPVTLPLKGVVTVLADNLGRGPASAPGPGSGSERKGIVNDFYSVKALKLPDPKLMTMPVDPFELHGFIRGMRRAKVAMEDALSWKFKHPNRQALIVNIDGLESHGMLWANGEPIALIEPGRSRLLLKVGEQIKSGQNDLRLVVFGGIESEEAVAKCVSAFETTNVTAKAEWSYAQWERPESDAYVDVSQGSSSALPCWYRCEFKVADVDQALWLDPKGMSKGQIYLNGRNAGRYWVATESGKAVPPQSRYYLPKPWLNTDGVNELVLFDEHGKRPGGCRLVYNAVGS